VTNVGETCVAEIPVYDDDTNQVPATWFAGDAGIRRLASQCDGPARGRCHFSPSVVAGAGDVSADGLTRGPFVQFAAANL